MISPSGRCSSVTRHGLPEPYAQGAYGKPGHHGALIRFSSASKHLGPDMLLGPVLGFAIKIFGVEGTKLVDEEPDSPTQRTHQRLLAIRPATVCR
jgi:hypothetical protein